MSTRTNTPVTETRDIDSVASLYQTSILNSNSYDQTLPYVPNVADVETISVVAQSPERIASVGSTVGDVMRAIRANGVQKLFRPGENLLTQGESARGLILIESGTVKIIDTSSGTLIDHDSTGGIIGELSLLTGQPCSACVVANTEVTARVLDVNRYKELCTADPRLEIPLGRVVSSRLGHNHHDALCGKELAGYRIQTCINRGGMGVVYRAEDDAGRRVALKMLMHKYIDDVSMHRLFDQEAALLSTLEHPNIVRLHDHFTAYRTRFLVLHLCDGPDLLSVLKVHGPLCENDARAILGQIASGVRAAHANGVLHRDLKPSNILVDREGNLRVTDFGLSRLREIDVAEGHIVGTPAYMAPELFDADDSGFSGDWYALACLAYELVTGQVLYRSRDVQSLHQLKRHLNPFDLLTPEHFSSIAGCGPVSDSYRSMLCNALVPDYAARRLNLDDLAGWAAAVPHLVV